MFTPLYRKTYDAATLLRDHPPKFRHSHKSALFELAYPKRSVPAGAIDVLRYAAATPAALSLPATIASDVRPDFYDYVPVDGAAVEWHVNFADPRLFVAYGSGLFAQDEMQVAEHPLLASVREALLDDGLKALTSDDTGPTPMLVTNVERRLSIATNPDAAAGRRFGLYGNRFADAPLDAIRRATTIIIPPTITHFIAIAAPAGGHGEYSENEIASIFANAFTAFAAAKEESARLASANVATVIHTGFWGCGAFGGNRKLMIALQSLAARAAKIDRLVLHAGDSAGVEVAQWGLDVANSLAARCGPECTLQTLADRAAMLGYRWGVGDGN